jgi:hypothetical protein
MRTPALQIKVTECLEKDEEWNNAAKKGPSSMT